MCPHSSWQIMLLCVFFWLFRFFHIFRRPIIKFIIKPNQKLYVFTENDSGRNNFNSKLPRYTCSFQVHIKFWPQLYILRYFIIAGYLEITVANKTRVKCWPVGSELLKTSFMNLLFFLYHVWAFHLQIKNSNWHFIICVFFLFFFLFQTLYGKLQSEEKLNYSQIRTALYLTCLSQDTLSNSSSSCSDNVFVWPFCNSRISLTSWWP